MKFPLRSTVQIGKYVATQQRKRERYPLVKGRGEAQGRPITVLSALATELALRAY